MPVVVSTYGDGTLGYSDDHAVTHQFKPLNKYGRSKHLFDRWALKSGAIDHIAGLKFFNVFGPHEYHKGKMASVVLHAYKQIQETDKVKLFKSYRDDYAHGEQKRDFVYVKDCTSVMQWLLDHPNVNGLFNLGTGNARSWNDLAHAVFQAMNLPTNIEYIEMPESLRSHYQSFTQAEMQKLRNAGYTQHISSLEEGVADYVQQYLMQDFGYLSVQQMAKQAG